MFHTHESLRRRRLAARMKAMDLVPISWPTYLLYAGDGSTTYLTCDNCVCPLCRELGFEAFDELRLILQDFVSAHGAVREERPRKQRRRRGVDAVATPEVPPLPVGHVDRLIKRVDALERFMAHGYARKLNGEQSPTVWSSTRLQCERMRQFRRNLFGCASRTRREQSIRPKISRIDFDLTEGRPNFKPVVDLHTGRRTPTSARAMRCRRPTTPITRSRARTAVPTARSARRRSP